jgi:hypothetical protein
VNSELAALYGVEARRHPITFVPVELPEDGPRAGILTLGAFLTMNAHETENSPTARGKYVRERVLCQDVPAPPPDIDLNLDPEEARGQDPARAPRAAPQPTRPAPAATPSSTRPASCSSTSTRSAPGDLDNGQPDRRSGDLDGKPLDRRARSRRLSKDDKRVGRCIVTQLYRHAIGRRDGRERVPALDEVDRRLRRPGYRFRELLQILVTSECFAPSREEEIDP